jgi:glutathione S-transferase
MADLEMIELYPSPWSERLRWVLEAKKLPYRRTPYVPLAGEEEHRKRTGIATAPVLIAEGTVIGDSDRAVDWIEERHPTPALVPGDPRGRAQVRAWELTATEVLAPFARLVMIGRYRAMGLQPLADHFSAKYHWSESEEARVEHLLRTALPELARAVEASPYLVGNAFTRADLTVAALVGPALGHPPDDLFELDPGMRGLFGLPFADDPALAPLRSWRDALYRKHRGGRVVPAAA